ncbi:MAG: hypothetical protein ACTSSE_17965 [Candidatus Thorarchaeota archaeon]
MCNETAGVEKFIDTARNEIEQLAVKPEEASDILAALNRLEETLHRLGAISNPEPIIQHWHFIQYGSAVLDYFDERTTPDGLSVAGGRWVYKHVSMTEVISIIRKLERFLNELDMHYRVVIGLPDRDSQIIGSAIAQRLDIPFKEANEDILCQQHSLVVTADNRHIVNPALGEVLQNQTLFSFNLNWLSEALHTPDVVGLMTQVCALPWSGGNIQMNTETGEKKVEKPDNRPVPQIVQDLVSTEPDMDPKFPEIIDFYKKVAPHLKAAGKSGSRRLPFRTDSPVPGSYFH